MNMTCQLRKKGEGFEGVVTLDGFAPTKLVTPDKTTTVFKTTGQVRQRATAMAKRMNAKLTIEEGSSKSSPRAKPVIKKPQLQPAAIGPFQTAEL